jgi:hypothetical protein
VWGETNRLTGNWRDNKFSDLDNQRES